MTEQVAISAEQATPAVAPATAERPKRFAKTRKVVRFLAGVEAWKRQTAILRHRARFPLLRRVWRREWERSRQTILLKEIDVSLLERSKVSHFLLSIVMGICLAWGLLNVIKGTVALVRFDVYLNTWLVSGIPLVLFAGVRLCTSILSYKLITEELASRPSQGDN